MTMFFLQILPKKDYFAFDLVWFLRIRLSSSFVFRRRKYVTEKLILSTISIWAILSLRRFRAEIAIRSFSSPMNSTVSIVSCSAWASIMSLERSRSFSHWFWLVRQENCVCSCGGRIKRRNKITEQRRRRKKKKIENNNYLGIFSFFLNWTRKLNLTLF